VVKNVKYFSLRDDPQQDIVFTPFFQQGAKAGTVLVRTAADPTAIASSVRAAIREIDATLPVYDVTTMDRVIGANLVQERLLAILSGFFGVLALGLCAIGLYGVLSYGVSQRTSEIGLRMALGARPGSILALILGETGRLLAIGIVLGVAIALASTRWIASVLYGVTPTDAFSISVAVAILAAVAMIAGFLPARRAARVDPMVALRNE
jgi:ABC-type antimicrobial peptide transport system permease subunit